MIKFIRDTLTKEGADYKAGDVLEASPASEERWIKRLAAVVCEPEPVKVEKPTPKPKAKPRAKRKR